MSEEKAQKRIELNDTDPFIDCDIPSVYQTSPCSKQVLQLIEAMKDYRAGFSDLKARLEIAGAERDKYKTGLETVKSSFFKQFDQIKTPREVAILSMAYITKLLKEGDPDAEDEDLISYLDAGEDIEYRKKRQELLKEER